MVMLILAVLPERALAQDLVPLDSGSLVGARLVPDTRTDRAEVYLVVFSGEADNPGSEGLMHYVMHLAWLSAVGQRETGFDLDSSASMIPTDTGYFIEGPAEDLDEMIELIVGVFAPFDLDEDFMLEQRSTLAHERVLLLNQDPYATVEHDLARRMYGDGPRSRLEIGTPEEIANYSLDEARALHAATHRPGNAALIVYGNASAEAVNTAIARALGTEARHGTLRKPFVVTPDAGRDENMLDNSGVPQPAVLYRKVIAFDEPRDIAALDRECDVLAEVLSSALSGGATGQQGQDGGVAQRYDLDIAVLDDSHLELSFSAKLGAGVSPEAILAKFEAALEQAGTSGIAEDRFLRARQRVVDLLRRDPYPARVVLATTLNSLVLGITPSDLDTYIAATERVELGQIDDLAAALAKPGRTVITLVYP